MDVPQKYICYLLTNTKNGKRYIGQTRASLDNRWKRHVGAAYWNLKDNKAVHALHHAIRKYGPEAFARKIIIEITHENINVVEQQLIKIYNTHTSNNRGYNQTWGGQGTVGYIFTDEDKQKMSLAHKGRKRGPRSLKDRAAISKAKKGIYTLTAEHSRAQSNRMKGRTIPVETREKIRMKMKQIWAQRKGNG